MRTPASTYRLQITAAFDLFAAARTLAYLHDLGVDWVYLSPLLEAEPGSDHGYDVVSCARIDPARGGAEGLAAVSAEARQLGMGVLVDVVPNHMGVATPPLNAWWWDVLTHGPGSNHAAAFDVDWQAGRGRLLLPVVGDDDLLADGRIGNLTLEGDELRYHDHRFPVAPADESSVEPVETTSDGPSPSHESSVEPVETTSDGPSPSHESSVEPVETTSDGPSPSDESSVEPVETTTDGPSPSHESSVEPVETTTDGPSPSHESSVEPVETNDP